MSQPGYQTITIHILPNISQSKSNKTMKFRAGKIMFFGTWKSVLLKASSGECCAPGNFVLLMTLGSVHIDLIVYLTMYQMR